MVHIIYGLNKNLIFIDQLDSTGYALKSVKSLWNIVKGAIMVVRDIESETLNTTAGSINMAAIADSASSQNLWHNGLRHMSVKGMKMMVVEEL